LLLDALKVQPLKSVGRRQCFPNIDLTNNHFVTETQFYLLASECLVAKMTELSVFRFGLWRLKIRCAWGPRFTAIDVAGESYAGWVAPYFERMSENSTRAL
jgi:hypothetical protein